MAAQTNKRGVFESLMPRTRMFLIAIYGSFESYEAAVFPDTNKYRLLDEVCMIYDTSLQIPALALAGLRMLGYELDQTDDCQPIIPQVALYEALTKITQSKSLMEDYYMDNYI